MSNGQRYNPAKMKLLTKSSDRILKKRKCIYLKKKHTHFKRDFVVQRFWSLNNWTSKRNLTTTMQFRKQTFAPFFHSLPIKHQSIKRNLPCNLMRV